MPKSSSSRSVGRERAARPTVRIVLAPLDRTALGICEARGPDGTVVVQLAGELDDTNTGFVAAWWDRRVDADRVRLDLSRLTFTDRGGLGLFVWARNRQLLRRRGGFELIGADGTVARLLSVTGLDEVLLADRHDRR